MAIWQGAHEMTVEIHRFLMEMMDMKVQELKDFYWAYQGLHSALQKAQQHGEVPLDSSSR
jgi:hypothetical protein